MEERTDSKKRPHFPKRAVITGGMPYGNKELHFGHIGGYFVHADTFARFLRDRIGSENVLFVSGTDCYGSPIAEKYRMLKDEGYTGDIIDFVRKNHEKQKQTLDDYSISLDLYGASAFGDAGKIHKEYSSEFFLELFETGDIKKLSNFQFYDKKHQTFLNGRQVKGRCPINGCKSEEAYADECSLGHQYFPNELIAPVSALSGERPELREVANWYFDIEKYRETLESWIRLKSERGEMRQFIAVNGGEFLKKPVIHIKAEEAAGLENILEGLNFTTETDAKTEKSQIVFEKLSDREEACERLGRNNIKYRTGKTLVPFRLTGNIEWGVPVPVIDGMDGLTFWVWPESLWAPISFVKAALSRQGKDKDDWKKWWASKEAKVYQFIGEDNIYFYGIAEIAMFMSLQKNGPSAESGEGDITLPDIIANKHILFFDKKASSSGKVKPPMAHELLEYYTAEQLRAHFLGLGLGQANVPFRPKPLNPDFPENQGDPVLKEGSLMTNVLNRAVRTLFYTLQKYTDGKMPVQQPDEKTLLEAETALLEFERLMHGCEFHLVMNLLDDFYRKINKDFSADMKALQDGGDAGKIEDAIVRYLHLIKAAALMAHPICPEGSEMIREYMNADERFWSWEYAFKPLNAIVEAGHRFKFLEPRVDFFKKHQSQLDG